MILHEVNLSKEFEEIELIPISDTHIGDPYFDEQLLMEDIEYIQEKENRFCLLNGDILNTATTHSVSDTYNNQLTPHGELKYARKLFEPIADSIICATQGNHERRITRNDGVDLMEELAMSLNAFYAPDGLVLKIRFGNRGNKKPQVYTIYMSHGFTGSRLTGGKANRLEKLQKIVVADIYIQSHTHQKINFTQSLFVPDLRNNKVVEKRQTFINTGAYLEWGGYAQQKAYTPSDRGTMKLKLNEKEKKVEVIM